MKKLLKIAVLSALILSLCLTACGKNQDADEQPSSYMSAENLDGTWADENGNTLVLSTADSEYTYRTWYGRIGYGVLAASDEDSSRIQLDFCDFYYDFIADENGFTLKSNGHGDGESLDGIHFEYSDGEIPLIPLSNLDGTWQNALGETLVIDSEKMQYISCTSENLSSGTIYNKDDGRGPYLFLNGYAYPRISADGNSFELFFASSDTQSPDGSFCGVFYRDGNVSEYANTEKSEFVEQSGHLYYYDGVNYFALPEGYSIADDGYAYNESGKIFAAGWEQPFYDPASDWGDGWNENWG